MIDYNYKVRNGQNKSWEDLEMIEFIISILVPILGGLGVSEADVTTYVTNCSAAYAKQYTVFGSTAQYYTLSHNENVDNCFTYSGYEVLGQDYATRLQNIPLTNIVYSSLAKEWNTRTLVGNVTTGARSSIIYCKKFEVI